MQMPVIIDMFLALILLVCAVLGWRRGAFKSVIGIVVVLAALLCAGYIANQGAPMAAKALSPVLSEQISQRLDQSFQTTPSACGDDQEQAEGLFSGAGLYQKTAENLARSAVEQAKDTGTAMIQAAAESLLLSAARAALFLVSFLVLLLVFKLVSHVLGLLTAVPGLHFANAFGGALLGLLQGCLILMALVWAAQFFGGGVPENVMQNTVLFRFFAGLNPIAMLSGFLTTVGG